MKKLTAFFLAVLMLFSLCACGSSAKSAEAPAAQYNSSYTTDTMMYDAAAEDFGGFAAAENGAASGAAKGGDLPDTDPQKIIYSADATIETNSFDEACAAAVALVEKYGGWVESSSINGSNYYSSARSTSRSRNANYQLRIPSEKFATLMGELSTLGNVPYSHTYTENISAQYYDLDARLTAYKTQETRLLEMMEKAQTVSDIITIEDRLTELRYQIESIQFSLNNWDRQVSYSLIGLNIEEVQEYTPETAVGYGQQLWQALVGGLKNAFNFLKDLLVFIVGALPVLILLAAAGFVIFKIVRKLRKARKAKKEKKALPTPEKEDK